MMAREELEVGGACLPGCRSILFALALGPTVVLADARRDCERLRGDAAIAACSQAIRENPRAARPMTSEAFDTTPAAISI